MRNAPLYAVFILLFAGALYLAVTQTTPQQVWNQLFSTSYKYNESEQGILFASNEHPIADLLAFYPTQSSYILSPVGLQGNSSLNSYITQSLIQEQIVLGGHQVLTRTVLRVFDKPNGTWLGCQTDYGTAKASEFISVADCSPLLTSSSSITINVEFPDPSRSRPLVLMTSSSITIYSVKEEDIPGVTFLMLRSIFPDASSLIGTANDVITSTQTPADTNTDSNSVVAA